MPTFHCTKLAERKTNEANKGDFTMMTITYSLLNPWFVIKCEALMKQTNAFVLHRWSVRNSFNWLLPSRFHCILFWCSPSTHEWLIARAITSLCIRMDRNSSCGCNQLKKLQSPADLQWEAAARKHFFRVYEGLIRAQFSYRLVSALENRTMRGCSILFLCLCATLSSHLLDFEPVTIKTRQHNDPCRCTVCTQTLSHCYSCAPALCWTSAPTSLSCAEWSCGTWGQRSPWPISPVAWFHWPFCSISSYGERARAPTPHLCGVPTRPSDRPSVSCYR